MTPAFQSRLALSRRRLAAGAAALALLPSAAAAQADRKAEGQAMLRAMAESVVAILSNRGMSRADREARFLVIFRQYFDLPAIGPWVMGRPWQQATPAERTEYLQVFETYIVKVYAGQLNQYQGEQLRVVGADNDDDGVVVATLIVDARGGAPVDIKWRLRPVGGRLKVRDVVIENISMSLNQRREFASVYQQRGSTVAGLIAAIREKVAELDRRP